MPPPSVITPKPTPTSGPMMNQQHQHQTPHVHHPTRARHTIRLSSIRHNFNVVSSAANKQKCTVITVVKADGYGHGAIATAVHLADYCGADAFAVATLDEGIALRKALMDTTTATLNTNLNMNNTGNLNLNPNMQGIGMPLKANNMTKKTVPITSASLFTPPNSIEVQSCSSMSTSTQCQSDVSSLCTSTNSTQIQTKSVIASAAIASRKKIRSNNIRIIVLGPPTDIPNDFNLYNHYNIEVMISSTKMARALMEWVADCDSRKIAEIHQVANERKEELVTNKIKEEEENAALLANGNMKMKMNNVQGGISGKHAATLTSMEGSALGKEFLALLHNQTKKDAAIGDGMKNIDSNNGNNALAKNPRSSPVPPTSTTASAPFPFKGIEDTAKESRTRELAAAKITAHLTGEDDELLDDENDNTGLNTNVNATNNVDDSTNTENDTSSVSRASNASPLVNLILNENDCLNDGELVSTVSSAVANAAINAASNGVCIKVRKKIRWHALIDSGMGRLGFKSVEDEDDDDGNQNNSAKDDEMDCETMFSAVKIGPNGERKVEKWKDGPHKDTVSILKAMNHAEIDGAPIEFYGMCTHMAEASSNSTYTNEQMTRFKSLLKRVRQAGICVPTISTDNSSALLTTNLTHFDPVELLSQPNADTRGYVRTGGAVYGQRPAFTQLRAVSSLTASVRHVATMEKGESVGYDRAYKAERNVRIATLSIGFADG
jgi:alanine racemase